jgi:hypothetical protein
MKTLPSLCVLSVSAIVVSSACFAAGEETDEAAAKVQAFMRRFERRSTAARFGGEEELPIRLVITTFEQLPERAVLPGGDNITRAGIEISESGIIHSFYHGPFGSKGGGYPQLPDAKLKRINELLAALPASVAELPVPDRCVLLHVGEAGKFTLHLYDRAELAQPVLEVLRTAGAGVRSWVPEFKSEGTKHGEGLGALTLTPDGKHVLASFYGVVRRYELATWDVVQAREVFDNRNINRLFYSRDGKHLLAENHGDLHVLDPKTLEPLHELQDAVPWSSGPRLFPFFTPDGAHLIGGYKEVPRIFDTERWEPAELKQWPDKAHLFFPAAEAKRAVVVPKPYALSLYDTEKGRELARLDDDAILQLAAFSPDETHLATVTMVSALEGKSGGCDIRVWNTATGKLVRTLRPYEQGTCETVEWLGWTPDGKHLLAAAKAHNFWTSRDICVWDLATGRQRGAFAGAPTNIAGIARTPDRLIAAVDGDKIYDWNFKEGMKEIEKFEASLRREK